MHQTCTIVPNIQNWLMTAYIVQEEVVNQLLPPITLLRLHMKDRVLLQRM
jgi:hypothetical protein